MRPYPEYEFVDLAIGPPDRRNNVVPISEAVRRIRAAEGAEAYVTIGRYPRAFLEHFKRSRSVRHYTGPVALDHVVFEIDGKDLGASLASALKLIDRLLALGVPPEAIDAYFSGRRSVHVRVLSTVFGIEPGVEVPAAVRALAETIAAGAGVVIDPMVFTRTALLRVPNTRHPETARFKILLSINELRDLSATDILELARKPRRDLPKANGVFAAVPELASLYQEALLRVRGRRSAGDGASSSNEAVIALLERRYVPDLRHRLVLALAGFAAKNDVPRARCLRIVELLVERAKDSEAEDRARAVLDSYEAVAEGHPAKGYRDLVPMLGEEEAAKLDKLLGKRWRKPAAAVAGEQAVPAAFSQLDIVPWIREHRADLAARLDLVEKSFRSLEADRQAILEEAFVTRRGFVGAQPPVAAERGSTDDPPSLAKPGPRPRANNEEKHLADQPTLFGPPPEAHESAEDRSPVVELGPALATPFRVIRSLEEGRRALEDLARRSTNGETFGFDLETIGLDPFAGEVRLSQFASLEGEALIIERDRLRPTPTFFATFVRSYSMECSSAGGCLSLGRGLLQPRLRSLSRTIPSSKIRHSSAR